MSRWGALRAPDPLAVVVPVIQQATEPLALKADLGALARKSDLLPLAKTTDLDPLAPKAMLSDYAKLVALLDYAKMADVTPLLPPVFRFYAQPSLLVVGSVALWAVTANRPFRLKRLVVRLWSLTSGTLTGALKVNGVTVQTFSIGPTTKTMKYANAALQVAIVEDDYIQLLVTGIGVGQGEFTMTLETTLT